MVKKSKKLEQELIKEEPGMNTKDKIQALETLVENNFWKRVFRTRNDVTAMIVTVFICALMLKVIWVELSYEIPRDMPIDIIGFSIPKMPVVMFDIGGMVLLIVVVNFVKEFLELKLEKMRLENKEKKTPPTN